MKMKTKAVTQSDSVAQSSTEAGVTELKTHEVDQVSGGAGYVKPGGVFSLTNPSATLPRKSNQYYQAS
ncbi:hypothetical protein UC34_22430 [Pandoraea vervacti]|uniref:Uncharacterized protein n=1 Tax=Pandoraea vervacti TaxID=656178 RepID=A0ABN4FTC1_9BURK|nr:hypothetical protein [Pandoraea vervacti]AJP58949.1 hypothetical protein UC34_22430 [Pandoraea vervacti]